MYDAAAGLGWRDVQSILALSARQVGSEVGAGIAGSERFPWAWNHAETWNGGGLHFSNDYGYGLVDAWAAVRLAESWNLTGTAAATTGNQFTNTMDVLNSNVVIPDGNVSGLTFAGTATFDDVVERVTVQMSFSTTFTGDVEVYLTSPDGTVSRLIADTGGGNDYNGTWTFESQAFRGERAAGNWVVRVVDDAGGDTLAVSDIVIRTWGADTTSDRYVFTNEYSDYDGVAGHRTNIADSNGGVDTVNAAAVSSASTIRLDGLNGLIDGVAVAFTNVEHAIAGDGQDKLFGNAGANQLYGRRNNDQMTGAGGNDTLKGGFGNDLLIGNAGKDLLSGAFGNDTFRFLSKADTLLASFDVLEGFDAAGAAVGDLIDLIGIDAKETIVGNQAFVFNSTALGGIKLTNVGNVTRIQGFTNNTAGADFQIDIQDGAVLASQYTAADFLL
ncbi:hypothetical protein Rumeso_00050 [Rubellimicrobium mesophilum DSM 19309]|uniref:P/Homo B domain-containing protein n=2 Tax=Rubellimicrobium TaxID=295418 RepID=A0A017HVE2_9RHOB|nr:hypothetical protein Rumeso_00050 [Rubellimicrobium mesophilum DSM 19309]